jgi:hypothetical protein
MAFVAFACVVLVESGGADTLVTKSGSEYVGTVTEKDSGYVLVTPAGGKMEFSRDLVASVIKGPVAASQPSVSAKQGSRRVGGDLGASKADAGGPATKPAQWPFRAVVPQGFVMGTAKSLKGEEIWVLVGEKQNGVTSTLVVVRGREVGGGSDLDRMVRVAVIAGECAAGVPIGSSGLDVGGAIASSGSITYAALGSGSPASFKFKGKGVGDPELEMWAAGMVVTDGKPEWTMVGVAGGVDRRQRAEVLTRATSLCRALKREATAANAPSSLARAEAEKRAESRAAAARRNESAGAGRPPVAIGPRPTRPGTKQEGATPRPSKEPATPAKPIDPDRGEMRIEIADPDDVAEKPGEAEKSEKAEWPFRAAVPAGFSIQSHKLRNGLDVWVLRGDRNGQITDTIMVLREKSDNEKGMLGDCSTSAIFAAEAAAGFPIGSSKPDPKAGVTCRFRGELTLASLGSGSPPTCMMSRTDDPGRDRNAIRVSCMSAGCKAGGFRVIVSGATKPDNKSYVRMESAVFDLAKQVRQELAQ